MKYIKKMAFITLISAFISVLSLFIDADLSWIIFLIVFSVVCFDLEERFDLFKDSYGDIDTLNVRNSYVPDKISAYIINLDRAVERLKFVLPKISNIGIPYQRIPAVDGDLLSRETIENISDLKFYTDYFKMMPESGTIGCTLSHEKAWKLFLESDNEFAIIFEDDVQFDSDEIYKTIKLAIDKKRCWDILGLELRHNGHPLMFQKLSKDKNLVFYMTNVKDAGAYIINRNVAHTLLNKIYPIKMPLDHYFTRAWEFNLRFCGVEPRMIKQSFGDSQIKSTKNKKIKSLDILIKSTIYKTYTALLSSIYNFYCYLFSYISFRR